MSDLSKRQEAWRDDPRREALEDAAVGEDTRCPCRSCGEELGDEVAWTSTCWKCQRAES